MSITLESQGLISRNKVKALIQPNNSLGIRFILANGTIIPVHINKLYSTQRNTVLGQGQDCVCLVEHFLAACALCGVNNIDVELSENELPFGDGSAMLWLEFFNKHGLSNNIQTSSISLSKERQVSDGDRYIKALPSDVFKVSYIMNWDHPAIGQQEYTWTLGKDAIEDLAQARTFSSELENQTLGLDGWILGFNDNGFNQELHFTNEPARHKALDLIGDLMLLGINPLEIKMHVISYKGGHELNSQMTKLLIESI